MDKEKTHKLDDLFRDQLEQHETVPAEDYWPYLEKKLTKLSFYKFGWKHINIYNTSSIAALLVSIPLIFFLSKDPDKTITPTDNAKTDTITSPTPEKSVQETTVTEAPTITKQQVRKIENQPTNPEAAINPIIVDSVKPTPVEETKNPAIVEPAKTVETKKIKEKKIIYVVQQDTIIQNDTVKVRRKRKNQQ